ncbi:hypothetical protein T552_03500 [Pneumocystis carinii B80]|uniref:6-phosphofructo-2-kinase domain-containing protein n=1 Tax=Pneumocystis carinii (strain B80) TaxID=1408658 RepID=A0A0W4ZAZ9_PNEC8|nr:hypothetical protein T552_03500 [Pneumocystis carinii B80]KTW25640.1 hypothetical protein T552_03500 [Pneumocystis carinii B80]
MGDLLRKNRICVCTVGLPARGKTYISEKVRRYLTWLSIPTRTFNVGNYRRRQSIPFPLAEFFNPENAAGEEARRKAAEAALTDMMTWFKEESGIVGILDATNSTRKRRQWIRSVCEENNVLCMFVESICNDEKIIINNIMDVKLSSPDYKGQDSEKSALDFLKRIKYYEQAYQPLDEGDFSYVKLIDVGQKVIINRIQDYLQSKIVYYLMNLHIKPRSIWLSRHGESEFNLHGIIGGDSSLSSRGLQYAEELPNILQKSLGEAPLIVWTSTLKRTIETAQYLPYKKLEWKALDELSAGVFDGMSYEEMRVLFPDELNSREDDKFNYRYSGGESYRDVVTRLEPVIMELERQENVLIISHQAILRCIYGYYHDLNQEVFPFVDIPLHTVLKLTQAPYSTFEERLTTTIPAVSTYRPKKPKSSGSQSKVH